MANLCSNCGSELADDATICESCGKAVETVEIAEPVQENEIVENEETSAKDGFIARMKMFAQKPLFLAAIILCAGGIVITSLASFFMRIPIAKNRIIAVSFGISYFITLGLVALTFWALWMLYSEAKDKDSVKKYIKALTIFKVLSIIGIVCMSICVFFLIIAILISVIVGIAMKDNTMAIPAIIVFVIAFAFLIPVIAYYYLYYISILKVISSAQKGIRTNVIQPLSCGGLLSVLLYITSISCVLMIIVSIAFSAYSLGAPIPTGYLGLFPYYKFFKTNIIIYILGIPSYVGIFMFARILAQFNNSLKDSLYTQNINR